MSRNTTAAVTSASADTRLYYRVLFEISSLAGGSLYTCTGQNYIYSGSNTYSPVGAMGGVEAIQEEPDGFPRALRAWISVVNSIAMAAAISETLFRKRVDVYRCFLTASATIVGTPQLAFRGLINQAELRLLDPEKGNYIEIEAESKLFQTGKSYYLNTETLQNVMPYSGDTFFNFVTKIPLMKTDWGLANTTLSGYAPSPQHWQHGNRSGTRRGRG